MLHERNIVLTFKTTDIPHVANSERIDIQKLSDTFTAVGLTYGFMELPTLALLGAGPEAWSEY